MNDYIERTIHNHSLFHKLVYWYRYEDDVHAIFADRIRGLKRFFNFINAIHPNIKFTIELTNKCTVKIPYLTILNI